MRILITGGCGFIGSHLVRTVLSTRTNVELINLDALTYAGNIDNVADVSTDPRYRFVQGDIADPRVVRDSMVECEVVLHVAAESHVDRSILEPAPFVRTNVVGTQVLLAEAVEAGVGRFVHVSTDEVYGELPWRRPGDEPRDRFTERSPICPRSPYAATKAAAEHLARAYHDTHGLDTVIVRPGNNYGSHQHAEKLIPVMVGKAVRNEPIPLYGDGLHIRDWIHVDDCCSGILSALDRGGSGEVYNLGSRTERTNLWLAKRVLQILDRDESLIELVEDRPGHDRRYGVDPSKAEEELAWTSLKDFESGFAETVVWYANSDEIA